MDREFLSVLYCLIRAATHLVSTLKLILSVCTLPSWSEFSVKHQDIAYGQQVAAAATVAAAAVGMK